jgi:hypothetical protein
VTTAPHIVDQLRQTLRERRVVVAGVLALLVPFALALALVPFRGSFANTAAALTFVAVITAIAIMGSRVSGVLAIASSAIWFDFYLTKPYDLLTISHRPDLETTICIVVVGLCLNELAAANRRSFRRARQESDYVRTMHEMVVLVSGDSSLEQITEFGMQCLREVLVLRDCTFESVPSGLPYARVVSNGTVVHVGLQWPTKELGIPGPQAEILAQWRGENFGRFVLTPTPGQPVSLDRRVVAVALANLVAGAFADEGRNANHAVSNDDT